MLNLSDKDDLHIFSVASESAHFHASFKHTVLPPRANLSIPVVFLAKVLGPAETSLVIQTNLGGFIYQVSGVGVPNQYAVEPLVGVKVRARITELVVIDRLLYISTLVFIHIHKYIYYLYDANKR